MRKVYVLFILLFLAFGPTQLFAQDFDGDGVNDITDVDDDNDGILDNVEVPSLACTEFPALDFSGATLISGTDLAVGAVYRYANVGLGIDALVTIEQMDSAGALDTFDDDGSSEISDATLFAPILSGGDGSDGVDGRRVQFDISFVESADNSIPRVFPNFIIVPTDIDGTDDGNEYQEYSSSLLTTTDDIPTLITTSTSGSFIRFDGPNQTFSPTSLNDTEVMVGLRYSSLSSFKFVIGTTDDIGERYFAISFDPCVVFNNFQNPSEDIYIDFLDSDADGLLDSRDLDADNDGILDNVEAQTVSGYIEPNDDSAATYAANNGLNSAYVISNGLTPVNTDGDAFADFQDTDSDNDTIFDFQENGDLPDGAGTFSDADNDGVDDDLDTNDNTVTWDVNGLISNGNLWQFQVYLGDADGDAYLDNAMANDLDFRDNTTNNRTSVDFDGTDDCMVSSTMNFSSGSTLMGWFLADNSLNSTATIAGQRNHSVTLNGSTGVLRAEVITQTGGGAEVNYQTSSSVSTAAKKGVWQHFASVVDLSANTIRLYLNGEEISTQSISESTLATLDSNTDRFVVGRNSDFEQLFAGAEFFTGHIYEVKGYNAALTAQQVQEQIFQEVELNIATNAVAGSVVPLDIDGLPWLDLQAYYQMEEVVNSKSTDLSTQNNRGQLLNTTSAQPRTAPLPLMANNAGDWDDANTWENGTTVIDAAELSDLPYSIVQLEGTSLLRMDGFTTFTLNRSVNIFGLLINSSAELELGQTTNSALTVNRYLDLDGFIDLQGESQLIQGNNSILDVASEGQLERDQQGTLDEFTYNYWGSPIGAVSTTANNTAHDPQGSFFDGTDPDDALDIVWITDGDIGSISSPIELSRRWLYKFVNDDWVYLGNGGTVNAGEGFIHKGPGNGVGLEQNYVFRGKPNNGTITSAVSADANHLVGNPYASAIDSFEFIDDNISVASGGNNTADVITGTLFFWQHWGGGTHVQQRYQGGYATLTKMGSAKAVIHPDVIDQGLVNTFEAPGRYIPVAQGFFVQAADGGLVTFENDQRFFITEATDDSTFFGINPDSNDLLIPAGEASVAGKDERVVKNKPITNPEEASKIWLTMTTTEGLMRQLLIGFSSKTTTGFDMGYDAEVYDSFASDAYWYMPDDEKKLIIQAMPTLNEKMSIPMGVISPIDGSISLKIDEMENVPERLNIYLFDKATGTHYDLKAQPAIASVSEGEFNDRFELRFNNRGGNGNVDPVDDEPHEDLIDVVYDKNSNQIIIHNPENILIEKVRVLNIRKKVVARVKTPFNDAQLNISMDGKRRGLYIVVVKTEQGRFIKKVLKRRRR